jgi:valyl-tRNA synthetase
MTPENPTELAKAYDPSAIEQKWATYWVENNLFEAPDSPAGAAFTMLLPPPNVTGRLHMGHMLNQTEMDILTRWHRMRGETALWLPGTDHAGIATQMMVEKQLAAEGKTTRQQLGREAFTERVWTWKHQYGSAITDQMKRLGASVDWSREYFTMDDDLSAAVIEAFVRLYEQGLIYRGAYIVNWDPVLQTAVSDLEVESEERIGKLYSIRYPLADGSGSIIIATTRPETMLGDTAVAVNPTDERYTALIGKQLSLPLTGRTIPILADDYANPEFGTGAVKVTPAHDPNDFAIGQRHALPSLSILSKTAHIDLPGSKYDGLDRYAARDQIVADLTQFGLLVEVKDHGMTVPVSQRSGSVIEPRLSDQWFIAVNKTPNTGGASIRDKAVEAVQAGHIAFTPAMYEKTYNEWMSNLHDWCISRQLWWGHRIPAWHCGACKAITVARTAPAACATCASTDITQETDVLDTWFSSGLLPVSVFGWPTTDGKPTADMNAFYPTSLLVTGFDILFFWVARMIMLGTHFMLDVPMSDGSPRPLAEAVPFRHVYIHGLIRAANREKMSKTKGNVIDPIDIINRFGTDAVRFTLASMASPGTDIAFNEDRTEGYRAFANKIWNAARFLFMNLDRAKEAGLEIPLPATTNARHSERSEESPYFAGDTSSASEQPVEDRWILSRLSQTTVAVNASLTDYRFDEAANTIYQFFWRDFCDWYLEIVKLRLNFEADAPSHDAVTPSEGDNALGSDAIGKASKVARRLLGRPDPVVAALHTLVSVFEASLRLLSPFMPFITEEIWHALYAGAPPVKSIALTPFPHPSGFPKDQNAEIDNAQVETMAVLQEFITLARSARKIAGVPEREFVKVRFHAFEPIEKIVLENREIIMRMVRASDIEAWDYPETLPLGTSVLSSSRFDVEILYERVLTAADLAAQRERLTKDLTKFQKGLDAANRQLSNESFTAKAPPHIIEGLRKQSAETQLLYDKTAAALKDLEGK